MTAVSLTTSAKVSYRNLDGGTVQFTALNLLEKDKWHYLTYGNNGVNVEINIDFIDPLCTLCGDVLTAQPFYYVFKSLFTALAITAAIHLWGSPGHEQAVPWLIRDVEVVRQATGHDK